MRTKLIFVAFLALALALAGCASTHVGQRFDTRVADQIEIGKTTESEVRAMLGPPIREKINQDGSKIWGYRYIEAQKTLLTSAKGRVDRLTISFNTNGIVKSLDRSSAELK